MAYFLTPFEAGFITDVNLLADCLDVVRGKSRPTTCNFSFELEQPPYPNTNGGMPNFEFEDYERYILWDEYPDISKAKLIDKKTYLSLKRDYHMLYFTLHPNHLDPEIHDIIEPKEMEGYYVMEAKDSKYPIINARAILQKLFRFYEKTNATASCLYDNKKPRVAEFIQMYKDPKVVLVRGLENGLTHYQILNEKCMQEFLKPVGIFELMDDWEYADLLIKEYGCEKEGDLSDKL